MTETKIYFDEADKAVLLDALNFVPTIYGNWIYPPVLAVVELDGEVALSLSYEMPEHINWDETEAAHDAMDLAMAFIRGFNFAKTGHNLGYDALAKKLDKAEYICSECAMKCGGECDHAATKHMGECDVCGDWESLANVGDWNWPDKKKRGMRD